MVEPALAGMASPAEAVRSCRAATLAAAAAVLGALLRHAGEPLAARAVLQAVVPALRTLAARRAGGSRQLTGQAWEAADDFDADVVEVALRHIAALAVLDVACGRGVALLPAAERVGTTGPSSASTCHLRWSGWRVRRWPTPACPVTRRSWTPRSSSFRHRRSASSSVRRRGSPTSTRGSSSSGGASSAESSGAGPARRRCTPTPRRSR